MNPKCSLARLERRWPNLRSVGDLRESQRERERPVSVISKALGYSVDSTGCSSLALEKKHHQIHR